MEIIEMFLKEFDQEAVTIRKMLERVPNDKYDWKPHPKSMTIRRLATHIAELPTWVTMAIQIDGLDFACNPYNPVEINNTTDLLAYFEQNFADARRQLAATNETVLKEEWTLRNGETIYMRYTKAEVIRVTISQIIHHRAQLGVFLRLLNIPIPGSYGPSADEQELELQEQD
jgi:uncharacterized damage-inducible protein DinB